MKVGLEFKGKIMKIKNNVTELIGNTPLVKLNYFSKKAKADIFAKCEFLNPGGSVKDRIGLAMIEDAEKKGLLKEGGTIIEPTSGNTGISISMVAATKGYHVILTMPDTMSIERRSLLKAFGAVLVLTPGAEGMKGAISKAAELKNDIKGSIILQQFENESNPEVHYKTTANEIWEATGGKIDAFVAGVGTGGTLSGVGKFLKEKSEKIEIIAVEPKDSPVLSGGEPGPHLIQGIGAGFIPGVTDTKLITEILQIDSSDAFSAAKLLAKKEGLFVGISAGANVHAASIIAKRNPDKSIITVLPDTGERYLSTQLFHN